MAAIGGSALLLVAPLARETRNRSAIVPAS
jgi:hypothetical protein